MAKGKVRKESTPPVVADAAKALADKKSSKKVKEFAASIVSDQGEKKSAKKRK